jgi:ADP-heptose:LPS heptosyltransferase
MIYTINQKLESWEAVSVLMVMQGLQNSPMDSCQCESSDKQTFEVFDAGGIQQYGFNPVPLHLHESYRQLETSQLCYPQLIAKENKLEVKLDSPKYPGIESNNTGPIVLCPFGAVQSLQLPAQVWRVVVKQLRTYYPEVVMISDGLRLDDCAFTEYESFISRTVQEKLKMLASARLVIGVPNAWTWSATAWRKPVAMLYPDDIPVTRWWPFSYAEMGRINYQSRQIQIPVLLAGIRKMIAML